MFAVSRHTHYMLRWLSSVLILGIVFGSVDAANDIGSFGACDEQTGHEVHGELQESISIEQDRENPAPTDSGSAHFCHCAVHAPALPASGALVAPPAVQCAIASPAYLSGTARTPPPIRPPKID